MGEPLGLGQPFPDFSQCRLRPLVGGDVASDGRDADDPPTLDERRDLERHVDLRAVLSHPPGRNVREVLAGDDPETDAVHLAPPVAGLEAPPSGDPRARSTAAMLPS